jgi:hypothetical protein
LIATQPVVSAHGPPAGQTTGDAELASAMALFGLFDHIARLALNAFDVRASSEEEPREQPSVVTDADRSAEPERPLDERFADFKARLADALAKRQR